jgi:large subunit ribosomal protein L24e
MGTTLRAMQRVAEIRTRREEMFYERRMKDAHKAETKAMKVELKANIELLAPAAADKEKVLLNVVAAAKAKTAAKKAKAADRAAGKTAQAAAAGDMSD